VKTEVRPFLAPKDFPVVYANQSWILSLPIYAEISDATISYVTAKLAEFFGRTAVNAQKLGKQRAPVDIPA
jgi:dTDP-4-amino-4,6-dideoxygalactose transaminase